MSRIIVKPFLAAGLVLTILAVGGCIFSPEDDPAPPVTPPIVYKWPDTREILMDNFKQAYGEMNIDEYRNVLHDQYKFVFLDGSTWERDDDLRSTDNMFAGNPPEDTSGTITEGVQSITINTLDQVGVWNQEPATHPNFPDSWKALYNVNIKFTLNGGETTITVTSQQLFYLKAVEVDIGDGATRTRYFLFGQEDLPAPT